MDEQLKELFYDPESGLQGAKALYNAAKDKGIKVTMKNVQEFLKAQEVVQVHQQPVKPKHFFPIKANHKDHIHQIDLADFSNIAHNNDGVTFLFCIIDVWSRYAWVYSLKKKTAEEVTEVMQKHLENNKDRIPQEITCDLGSEWINSSFKNLAEKNKITMFYAQKGDKHRVGIVERFIKTLRSRIDRYRTASKGDRYIDQLQKMVKSYNNTRHSSIGSKPNNPDPKFIAEYVAKREDLAEKELKEFAVGDQVRHVTNRVAFQKGSAPKYSAKVFTIEERHGRSYKLAGLNKEFKYYELEKINTVQTHEYPPPEEKKKEEKKENGGTAKIIPKAQRLALKKEGLDAPVHEAVRRSERQRRPVMRLTNQKGEGIFYS